MIKMIHLLKKIIHKIKIEYRATTNPWILYKDYISIHPSVIIDPAANIKFFNPPVPPEICLEIGEGSHVFSTFNMLRPQSKIKIGKNCQIGAVNFVCAESIEVGNDVIMAWGITFTDSNHHSLYWDERQYDVKRCREDYLTTNRIDLARTHDWSKVNINKIKICNKAWIGFNSIILKGVTIGEGAIIGAGSVVVDNVPSWVIGNGNPFKIRKEITITRRQQV